MEVVFIVILVIAAIFVARSLKVVPQQHAWVVERLGKYHATLTPGLNYPGALHRPRGLPAFAEGDPARRAEPGLHHQRQHPAHGRRHPVLPGHRPDARQLRLVELHRRHHAAGADHAAQRDRQDGARQDLRGAHGDQHRGGQRARRSGAELGREGAALRDQGPDAAGGDPACDAGADHRRAREARADRRLAKAGARSRSTSPPASARPSSPAPKARSRPRSTTPRARPRPSSPWPKPTPRRSARWRRRSANPAASRRCS